MKRSYSAILIIIISFFSLPTAAQSYIQFKANLNLGKHSQNHHLNDELREIKVFHRKVDLLLTQADRGNWRKAKKIKASLLRDMKHEMRQTRDNMHLERQARYHKKGNRLYKKRPLSKFNKRRNNTRQDRIGSQYAYYENLLQRQKHIYREFEYLQLGYGRNDWRRIQQHEDLLFQFIFTMEEQLPAYASVHIRRGNQRGH